MRGVVAAAQKPSQNGGTGKHRAKKGVSDRVASFLSNAKFLFHMTFSILFYE